MRAALPVTAVAELTGTAPTKAASTVIAVAEATDASVTGGSAALTSGATLAAGSA